ncbi:hypothetical protein GCM10010385_55570 [Streptomyces geysiriensis]|nr:hypothetical protein GCM10010385_55570 [Streptomyces geysiriensis]
MPLPVGSGPAGTAGAAAPFLFLLGEASGKLVVATDVPSFFLRVGGWEGSASAERTGALGLGVDGRPVTARTTGSVAGPDVPRRPGSTGSGRRAPRMGREGSR